MLSSGCKTLMQLPALIPKAEQDSKTDIRVAGEQILFLFMRFLPWFLTICKSLNLPLSWFPIHLHVYDFFTEKLCRKSWTQPNERHRLTSTPVRHSFTLKLYWKSPHFCHSGPLVQPGSCCPSGWRKTSEQSHKGWRKTSEQSRKGFSYDWKVTSHC